MSFFFGPGADGFGGFGGGGDSDNEGGSDNQRFYDILKVNKNATANEIKKSYRKLARDLHPDKHPGEESKYREKFQDLQKAYETLSDPKKKQLYDRFGEQGLKGAGGGGGGMSDIFDMFFDGQGPGGRGGGMRDGPRRGAQKAPMIKQILDVKLEDFYHGNKKEIEYEKSIICPTCKGKGGSKVIICPTCNGTGRETVIQKMGYMSIQTQRTCRTCNGTGELIKNKCRTCKGRKTIRIKKKIDFEIPIGAKHGSKHLLRSQGNEIPDAANGDVVIIFRCKEHKVFKRIGADLAMEYNLTLREALCGYDIKIKHLSGKILRIKSKKGEVTPHEQLKAVYSWGMPQKNNITIKGHLYIKFKIIFPETGDLTIEQINQIKKLINKSKSEIINDKIDAKMAKLEKDYEEKLKEKQLKKQQDNKMNEDNYNDDDSDHEYERLQEIHEEAEDLGNEKPKVTPASARSAYDEDEEEQQQGGCRQM